MAYVTVFNDIPDRITAGESVAWSVSLSDYPASESWVLTYTLVKAGLKISIIAQADGDNHLVQIPFATTAGYQAGTYHFQAHAANGTERYLVGQGKIEILPDFAEQSAGYDARPWYDVAIDALEASVQGRASKTQMSQMVGKVQVQHMTLDEQLTALRRLKSIRYSKTFVKTGGKKLGVRF